MQIRFLLGPAGSGKTFRCLAEIRQALLKSAEGPPLILLAPKQATFQLERQLLSDPALRGYTRLHILSFERLAEFVFREMRLPQPELLSDLGRLMVLRALLAREQAALRLFHATARLPGFARQLSLQLREFQRYQFSPETLKTLAGQKELRPELQAKLHDLAALFEAYLQWLKDHRLEDVYRLPDLAAEALHQGVRGQVSGARDQVPGALRLGGIWLDGFAEMTPQELNLLAAVVPCAERATLAFCLDQPPAEAHQAQTNTSFVAAGNLPAVEGGNLPPGKASGLDRISSTLLPPGKVPGSTAGKLPAATAVPSGSWLSHWSAIGQTFEECRQRLEQTGGATASLEILLRQPSPSRFSASPILAQLERFWAAPESCPQETRGAAGPEISAVEDSIRMVRCATPETEAIFAAHEILRFVRKGGRYREAAVIVRDLEGYRQCLERAFRRFEIPCFLDQREPAAHHPLAELTRGAVRTVAFDWQPEDWFGALKTGLVTGDDAALDWLENEALARGWKAQMWAAPIRMPDKPELESHLEKLRQQLMPPFESFQARLAQRQFKPTGPELAGSIRELWRDLEIERQLQAWSAEALAGPGFRISNSIHLTVWDQMNEWLETLSLAFSREPLLLREWLPILEAGLAELTVGVIPPALDQVLVGAVDRSRNPDLKLALVLGLNESSFPAPPSAETLLTEADRDELLTKLEPRLGPDRHRRLAQERYYGYIAFTRARQRVALSCSEQSDDGQILNPSPFIAHLQRLFPQLRLETAPAARDWRTAEHVSEIIPALLRGETCLPAALESSPPLKSAMARWRRWQELPGVDAAGLSPAAVQALYGNELRSSVSALETFAACPFQFFVHHGLHAGERKRFEADPRQTGSFQHEILSQFHQHLQARGRRWRDCTLPQARELIAQIGAELAPSFAGGLFQADARSRFLAARLIEQLQDFVEAAVGWMTQYQFDPHAVELGFGLRSGTLPAWRIDLGNSHALLLRGKIDRVDLFRPPGTDSALAVVMDYKSSPTKLDPTLLQHGLELQLLSYLGVLRHSENPRQIFGAATLVPAGIFYVPLRARPISAGTRHEVLGGEAQGARIRFQHSGRFDGNALPQLDSSGSNRGTQFRYARNKNGEFSKMGNDAMPPADFTKLLDHIEAELSRLGRQIFAGTAKADPYRKGNERACAICVCQTICRFDPWVDPFRVLRKLPAGTAPPTASNPRKPGQ